MKTNKIMVMALLLAIGGASFTSCAVKDNEKVAEIVDDPIKATTEYYINGKAVDANGNSLADVTVKAQDGTAAKTAADGSFSLTVKATGNYGISASKSGFLNVNTTVNVPSNATNRASFNTSFIMTAKAADVTVAAQGKETVVISTASNSQEESMDDVKTGMAVEIPTSTENVEGAKISMTEYVPEAQTVNENEASVANVYIETSADINATGVKLAVANPVNSSDVTFQTMKVYKSTASRSGNEFSEIGTAALDKASNKFTTILTNGNLAGDYSFRVSYASSKSTGKDSKSGEKDNSGSLNAIRDYQISYEDKMGWEYSDLSGLNGLDSKLQNMIKNAVKSCQGAEGVTKSNKTLTTNISGNSILYYTAENNYTVTTYTFTLSNNKKVAVKTKTYTGTNLKYTIASADQHSGGTGSGM